jgi:DNA topoisomerase III
MKFADSHDAPPPPPPRSRARRPPPAPTPVPPRQAHPPPAPPPARRPPPSDSDAAHGVTCNCGAPAAERTVTKESASKGRRFWTCGKDRTCDFFEWFDGPSANSTHANAPVVPTKRSYTNRSVRKVVLWDHSGVLTCNKTQNLSTEDNEGGPSRLCRCELTAVQRTVLKEGLNQGRVFWRCPNSEKAQCDFFEWDDEPPRGGGGSMSGNQPSVGGSGGNGGQSGNKCFKVCFKVFRSTMKPTRIAISVIRKVTGPVVNL